MAQFSYHQYIQHFSHPHQLELTQIDPHQTLYPASCSGCSLQSSGWVYTCKPCNFTLHLSCTQMPQLINHPSHPHHSLTLLSSPIYPGGLFNCDGCGHQGNGFSYHCTSCDFDLHILCASKPLSLTHQSHACQLMLTFDPPYENKCFTCNICRRFGSEPWLYRCSRCQFDAHLDCAATANVINAARPVTQTRSQVHSQHYNSFPGAHQVHNGINRPGGIGMNQQYVHSQSAGAMQGPQQLLVQGFLLGVGQQVGQNSVQGVMNDGNNGDPGNDGGNLMPTDNYDFSF